MEEFKVVIYINQVYIDHYDEVVLFDENEILLRYQKQYIRIKGQQLTISKLLNNELLVNGKVLSVELPNNERLYWA